MPVYIFLKLPSWVGFHPQYIKYLKPLILSDIVYSGHQASTVSILGTGCSFSLFLYSVSQLAYCVVQFLEKDPTLTEPVIVFFLKSFL